MVDDAERQLEALLAEPVAAAVARERGTYDRAASPFGDAIVLFGAGGLGRLAADALRAKGVEPLAFADNDRSRWNTTVGGVTVLSPEDAAARFGDRATFVVTIWGAGSTHRFAHSREQLESLGCRSVQFFPALFWKHADALLPYYAIDLPHKLLDRRNDVARGFALLADDRSRAEYVAQVRMRLHGDFDGLPPKVGGVQYFPRDVYAPRDDETFVDCGAFDGDTLRAFVADRGARFARYIALEPDPSSRAALEATVATLPEEVRGRIEVLPTAAHSARTTLHLAATGTAASAITSAAGDGSIAIDCAPMDEMPELAGATFIKMDIEGAEPDALEGARALIARDAPLFAISAYHRQDHLWRIAECLNALRADYRFYLRPHNEQGWDLVLYAVPADRLVTRGRPNE